MKQKIGKYTVKVLKHDGAESIYFVYALSAGGAEKVVLSTVYAEKWALATEGWPVGVTEPDFVSRAALMYCFMRELKNQETEG